MIARLLLASLLAAPASARSWPDCLHVGPKRERPRTLADLRSCQKKAARRLDDRAEAAGKPLSDAERDSLADHQRAEARRFMARTGVVVEGPKTPAAEPDAGETPPAASADDGPGGDDERIPPQLKGAAMKIKERFQAAGLASIPESSRARLKAALESSGGRITPEIDRIVDEEIAAARSR